MIYKVSITSTGTNRGIDYRYFTNDLSHQSPFIAARGRLLTGVIIRVLQNLINIVLSSYYLHCIKIIAYFRYLWSFHLLHER